MNYFLTFLCEILKSQASLFGFSRLTWVNPSNLGPDPLVKSTSELGLITMLIGTCVAQANHFFIIFIFIY